MKKALTLSGIFALLSAQLPAEWQAGNGAIQLDTSLTAVYDSNFRAAANGDGDYHLTFEPTLRYKDNSARFQTEATAAMRFRRYLDNPGFNSDDPDLSFIWRMPRTDGYTTGATLQLGYVENSDAVFDVNERVKSKNFTASASGEVLVAQRNLLSAGVAYHDNKHSIGSDQTGRSARVGYSYVGIPDGTIVSASYSSQHTETGHSTFGTAPLDQTANTAMLTVAKPLYAELNAVAGYGYRWLDRGTQEEAIGLGNVSGPVYNLSLEGQFLPRKYFPKTTGTFRLAYEQADTPGLNDRSGQRMVGQLNVNWAARETTNVRFFASRSQDLSITDNTVVTESTGLSMSQAIGSFINSTLGFTYTNADFVNIDRTDDRYLTYANATYRINRAWSSDLAYTFLHSVSSEEIANFNRHTVSLTLTYAF